MEPHATSMATTENPSQVAMQQHSFMALLSATERIARSKRHIARVNDIVKGQTYIGNSGGN